MTGTDYVPLNCIIEEIEKGGDEKKDDKENKKISFREKLREQVKEYEINKRIAREEEENCRRKKKEYEIEIILEKVKGEIKNYSLNTRHSIIMLHITPKQEFIYPEPHLSPDSRLINKMVVTFIENVDSISLNILKKKIEEIGFRVKKTKNILFFNKKCPNCKYPPHAPLNDGGCYFLYKNPCVSGYYLSISWEINKKNADPFFYVIREQTGYNQKKVLDDLNREINEQFENIKKILDKKSKEGKKTVWIIFVCDSEYCQCREFPTDKEAVIQTKYYLGVSLGNKFVSILKSKLRNIGFSSIFSSTNLFRVSDNMECYHNYILGHFLEISIVDNPFCQIL